MIIILGKLEPTIYRGDDNYDTTGAFNQMIMGTATYNGIVVKFYGVVLWFCG